MLKIASYLIVLWLVIHFFGCGSHTERENQSNEISIQGGQQKASVIDSTIVPKLYLEHSGSMFAYDSPSSAGQFKNTLVTVLNNFNALKPTSSFVYIVNDQVYEYSKDFKGLVESPTIFQKGTGNSTYTDFEEIFSTILRDTKNNQIAILFSDLIYSGKGMQTQASQKILDAAQQLSYSAFATKAANISVLIIKLQSDYKGRYYPFNMSKKGIPYSGLRPYYLCLFAENATMQRFLTEEKYTRIRAFINLPNYQNALFFGKGSFISNPYYTILEGDAATKGRQFSPARRDRKAMNGIHSIENVKPPKNGYLTIPVAVSLPEWAFDQTYVLAPTNYEVESMKDRFKILRIEKLSGKRKDGTTHKIILQATVLTSGERTASIRLKRVTLPSWVEATHSADDRNLTSPDFSNQTFGFKSIMQGIADAYEPISSNNKFVFTLQLTLTD